MNWLLNPSPHCSKIESPKSFFLTEFNPSAVRAFQNVVNQCLNTGQPFLPIFIESYGGAVDYMSSMLSIIDAARPALKIVTVTNGLAVSCGALVFAYGDHGNRFVGTHSRLLFHNISCGIAGKIPEGLDFYQKSFDTESVIFEKVSKHLKKPKDFLRKNLEKRKNFDWELTPEDAVKEGIATAIDSPKFILAVEEKFIVAPSKV